MKVIVLTPVPLLGDALAASFERHPGIEVVAVVNELSRVRLALASSNTRLVLVDVTQGIDVYDMRPLAAERPDLALVAFGLREQRDEVVRCGRAGFTSYVSRDATIESLCGALFDVVNGRVACPAEIAGGLLRALFRPDAGPAEGEPQPPLTRRESDVLQLIGDGLSNKEIARELLLSVSTVKNHVHNILDKLRLPRRTQAMRRVRDAPWLLTRDAGPRKTMEK